MRRLITIICLFFASIGASRAAEPAAPPFQAGDRVCVIGDSITHGRRYHLFVAAFYATRLPDRRIEFLNCGIAGDTASGALKRFDWDIAACKPTVSTILLGMNDVGINLYGEDKTGDAVEKQRAERIEAYRKNMTDLMDKLAAIGSRTILLTPTIYDDTATMERVNYKGANGALARAAAMVRELAAAKGAGLVEVFDPMAEINGKGQEKDPKFTIVGPDRVHPLDPGQFLVAYEILKAQGLEGPVSAVEIDAAGGKTVRADNAAVDRLAASTEGVSFQIAEKALPFPMPKEAEAILAWVPFAETMNRETLAVGGLKAGAYDILIDDRPVARASAEELAAGVDLAANTATPMYQQAMEVYRLVEKRFGEQVRLRYLARVRHTMLPADADPADMTAVKPLLDKYLEGRKGKDNYAYYEGQVTSYMRDKPQEAAIQKRVEDLTDQIYSKNRPGPHTVAVRPASADAPAIAAKPAADTLEDFDSLDGWSNVSITNVEGEVTAKDGIVHIKMTLRPNERDLWCVSMPVSADLSGFKKVNVRVRADKGGIVTFRMQTPEKLESLISYVHGTGEWQTLSADLPSGKISRAFIILGEPGANEPNEQAFANFEFDRIWFE